MMQFFNYLAPQGKKQFLANLLDYSGVNSLLNSFTSWSGLLVLNYHRIGFRENTSLDRNLFSATAEELERQIVMFQRHADIIGIDDLTEINRSSRGKYILLTFDDGYRDNYELAFPVLKDCRAKATFFIPSGFIDSPRVAWWDEIAWMVQNAKVSSLPACSRWSQPIPLPAEYPSEAIGKLVKTYWALPNTETPAFLEELAELTQAGRCPQTEAENIWMTWDMIRELHAAGQDIGGHTVNHPVLAQCSPAEQETEILAGRQRLQEILGTAPEAFSYPVGQAHMFTEQTQQLVKAAGYRWAFSFYGNYGPLPLENPFDIPRCSVYYEQPGSLLRSRLTLPQIFAAN